MAAWVLGLFNLPTFRVGQRVLDVSGPNHSKILSTATVGDIRTGVYLHYSWYGGGGFIGTESNHNLYLMAGYSPRMSVLTNGSVGIGTTNPGYLLQVYNAHCDGNTWYNVSDKNMKENFVRIRTEESILDKVLALPIQYWNYKGDTPDRHIGPTAQDFHKVFGLGTNEKAISTIDESGVALAAIQELGKEGGN